MKITRLTTFIVPPRWCFLKIETDEGITGWGEPVLEGRAHTVAAAVDELADYLVGKDPRHIEDHWTVLYRGGFYRGGGVHMSALAGIDQALWDIKGKALGVPVSELLGGSVRDRIRVYSWIGGDRPSDTAAAAKAAVERGDIDWVDDTAIDAQEFEDALAVWELGPGETECILAAKALGCSVACDDGAARKVIEREIGIPRMTGTVGLLREAVVAGLITAQQAYEAYQQMKRLGGFLPKLAVADFEP